MHKGTFSRALLRRLILAPGLYLAASVCAASALDLSIHPGVFGAQEPDTRVSQLTSGIDLALRNRLLDVKMGYDFRVDVDNAFRATDDNTAQHLGATLHSNVLDSVLGVKTRVQANSVFHTAAGAYNHRLSPGFVRRLADLALLDVNYQYHLVKPSADAVAQEHLGYSVALRGSLQGGRLNWSGDYSAADTYRESAVHIQTRETFRFQSSYRLLPQMRLQLTSALTEMTRFHAARDVTFLQTQYGAGLQWTPSADYSLNVNVNQTGFSHTGEEMLLRTGTLSWFPHEDMALSLNYGDQLVEGTPGILLNTRLVLDAL